MDDNISSSNKAFNYLKNVPEFLNAIINDIGSCIMLLNQKMELVAFNNPMSNLFIDFKGQDMHYIRCGEAIGCAYTVEEKTRCGETTKCKHCELRVNALQSYTNNTPIYNKQLSREFYKNDGEKELRHLRYSCRSFEAEKEFYIMLIINDITELKNKELKILEQAEIIVRLEAKYSMN